MDSYHNDEIKEENMKDESSQDDEESLTPIGRHEERDDLSDDDSDSDDDDSCAHSHENRKPFN